VLPKSILRRAIPEYYLFASLLSWWLYCIACGAESDETLAIFWQPSFMNDMTSALVAATTNLETRDRTTTLLLERATPQKVTPRFKISRRALGLIEWAASILHSSEA
jgi:hypothetical protein